MDSSELGKTAAKADAAVFISDRPSERPRPPSWLSKARASVRAPSFMPESATRGVIDPSTFANRSKRGPLPHRCLAAPRVPSGHVRIEDAELVEVAGATRPETPPPAPRSASPAAHTQLAAERALLEEARAATERERAELDEMRRAYAEAAAGLAVERARQAKLLEGEMADLAVVIAEALVGTFDASVLAPRLAREVLTMLPETERATLRVSAAAAAAITEAFGETFVHDGVAVRVRLDPTMQDIGCVLDTEQVRIDGRLSERLAMVGRAIHDARADEEAT